MRSSWRFIRNAFLKLYLTDALTADLVGDFDEASKNESKVGGECKEEHEKEREVEKAVHDVEEQENKPVEA